MRIRKWLAQAVAVVLALMIVAAPAAAQTVSSRLQAAFVGLQNYYDVIGAGVESGNPAVQSARAQEALTIATQVRDQLSAALDADIQDDAVRSRVQAVLGHVNQAIEDLQEGLDRPDLLSAKLREAEARGCGALDEQIGELIDERAPGKDGVGQVCQQDSADAPSELPRAGGIGLELPFAALAGSMLAASGLALRLTTRRR